jgi:hypothetical protein
MNRASRPAEKGSTPQALFFICPLGRFERVDLLRRFFDLDFDMGGCGTFSGPPFSGRIRINAAVLSRRALDDLAASLALVDDHIAGAPVESAAFLRHEAALDPIFNRLTNHGSLLFLSPVMELSNSKKNRPISKTTFMAKSGRSFPFCKKRALLSEYENDVKKIFRHHISPKSRKNFCTLGSESIDFSGPFMIDNTIYWWQNLSS